MEQDRVQEKYDGTFGSWESQRTTRRRIHWMCRHAAGPRVLDVGCSQGTASLILGREGRTVVGVDVQAKAIDDARRLLAREEPVVRNRVEFVIGEITALPFADASFDTVLLG